MVVSEVCLSFLRLCYNILIMFNIFKKYFSKKKTPKEVLKDIAIGDIVVVELKNLKEIGVVDPSGYFSKRFEPEDYDNFKLTGTLTRRYDSVGIDFIELVVVKINPRREKQYCIMTNEIRNIRKVNING